MNFSIQKTIAFLLLASFIFTSCFTTKKFDDFVAQQYPVTKGKPKKQNDVAYVASNVAATNDKVSNTENKTSDFLPLVVYWQWDSKKVCTLNPNIPVDNFTKSFLTASNKLKEKLNGQTVELTIEKMPNVFSLHDKMHIVFVLYILHWESVFIQGENMETVVSYRLLKDGAETKKGTITVPYQKDRYNLGWFQSWKKATTDYLGQYDGYITSLGKMVVDKIATQL